MSKRGLESFFRYAVARQAALHAKRAGVPKGQQAGDDSVLNTYSFCNVFREDDKVTTWFRENVRERMRHLPEVMLATVIFRMFNRIDVGEAIFRDDDLLGGMSAFDEYLRTGRTKFMRDAVLRRIGRKGPFVTGAYIITGPGGKSKLDGILWVIDQFNRGGRSYPIEAESLDPVMGWCGEESVSDMLLANRGEKWCTLQAVHAWFSQFPYLGTFHSYEIVTDLRHTSLLDKAPDIMTWANPGPGARRGLNRIHGRALLDRVPGEQLQEEMREILARSRDALYWPQAHKRTAEGAANAKLWPKWEMRDVEHTLCEFDKYVRTQTGQGRPRGRYR